ncbi:MAG: alginate biosynthesis protein AlgP, partial [Betaproteobacteria bacterium]|nr:alginate biosynthesis protein AlgP [Betaproteobacteria bacterium]
MGGLFDFKAMFDAMEVARRNWSAMPVPSSLTPTIDPAELDKRIADLKTVEQWLVLNLNLLRGSIQALELQRAALASLQSFGEAARAAAEAATQTGSSAREADRPAASSAPTGGAATPAWTAAGIDPGTWWQTLQSQFQQVAESALSGIAPAATDSAAAPPETRASARGPSADPAAPAR